MATDSQSSRNIPVALAIGALIYTVAYAADVVPTSLGQGTGLPPWPRLTHYRLGGKGAKVFFTPANYVDKKVFPNRWLDTLGVAPAPKPS